MPHRILVRQIRYAATNWGVAFVITGAFASSFWFGAAVIADALDRNTAAFDRNTFQLAKITTVVQQQNLITHELGVVFREAGETIAQSNLQSKVNHQILLKIDEELNGNGQEEKAGEGGRRGGKP